MLNERSYMLDEWSSKKAAAYLRTNDLAILPLGNVEMHGPLIPLGCDSFNAHAVSLLLAEAWDAVVLPPVNYVFCGATGPWPGSINVSPEASIAYVKEVARAAIRAGFKRLILCYAHAPLNWMTQVVIRSLFLETGEIVAALMPFGIVNRHLKEEFGRGGEDLFVLGSLDLLGLDGAFDPRADIDKPGGSVNETQERLGQLKVAVPWLFSEDHQHTGIHSDVKPEDAKRAASAIRKAIGDLEEVPELFARHKKQLTELASQEPWKSDRIWSVD
jgi:creatinine amidohydrolase/Fe(II)-dependent formamide hydrolase-like protein